MDSDHQEEQERLSYTSSSRFSIRVGRRLPNWVNSVNLKYVMLGYRYLLNREFYFLAGPVVVAMLLVDYLRQLVVDFSRSHLTGIIIVVGMILYLYFDLIPRPTFLVDFACYCPPDELKVSKKRFIELAKESGKFNKEALEFQTEALKSSGIGDSTYLPKTVFHPNFKRSLNNGREEAKTVMFSTIDDLITSTGINPREIGVLVVNCSILNTTPSLSAMVINQYKLNHNIQSYNLGGMGCGAGVIAIDLARSLLDAHPTTVYGLVVSTEIVNYSWYVGNEVDMLLPNVYLRMGAAAVLLSNSRLHRWKSKYQLKQIVRTHNGEDKNSYNSIRLKEDKEGKMGLSVSKNVVEVATQALKTNISTLYPLLLPLRHKVTQFFTTLLITDKNNNHHYLKPKVLPFNHICINATSSKVLDEIQRNLDLTEEYMEPSRKTLERFGYTSSSSVWYQLGYLEVNGKIGKGDRVCQIVFGSGFKCNTAVWKAVRSVQRPAKSPWFL